MTDDTLVVIGADDCILAINRTLPPSTPETVVGTSIYRYQFEDDHPVLRRTLAEVRATAKPSSYETKLDMRALGIDADPRWFITRVLPMVHREPGGLLLIATGHHRP